MAANVLPSFAVELAARGGGKIGEKEWRKGTEGWEKHRPSPGKILITVLRARLVSICC